MAKYIFLICSLVFILGRVAIAEEVKLGFKTLLPLIEIKTENNKKISEKKEEVQGVIKLWNKEENSVYDTGFEQYEASFKLRGSSSSWVPKKQYTIKISKIPGKKKNKIALLGLHKDNSFVLNAPYYDKSQIRNGVVYEMAEQMGLDAPHTRYVELVVNGKYQGIYVLTEKIHKGFKGIKIPNIEDGGFIVKADGKKGPYIKTALGTRLVMVYPDKFGKNYNFRIAHWMDEWLSAMEKSLPTPNWEKYINVDSFINFFLIQELWKNIDSFRYSMYMYKGFNNKLTVGPVWDFDLAGGNLMFYRSNKPDGWRHAKLNYTLGDDYLNWFNILLTHPSYRQKVIARWKELRKNVLTDESIDELILKHQHTIGFRPIRRNFLIWNTLNKPLSGNLLYTIMPFPITYPREVLRLRYFMVKRAHWIDENIDGIGQFKPGELKY